ncbi:aromatic ring-hydroxylating oxygenase subunit alpha [Nocardia arthritidis]|uniref:aromatic ring-hydroxylating oxygenase subunit alpha n=1 Tax=Nocardia arthritidis TaxID=228602 RepID=UPI000A969C7E|nr:Rieske 2Fe-2S domain-containing protein [Nocardia arthritidis]
MTAKRLAAADVAELVLPDRVHGRLYTDSEIFEAEMETIFEQGWVFIGHEREVPNPGDFRTSYIGRQPVIMSRDTDDEVHVVMNRCTHRASLVCMEESGNSRTFRCPYHQWTFRNSGKLVGVPYPNGYGPDFDKSEFDLARPPRIGSYRGFLFASMAPDGPSLDDHIGPLVKEQIDLFLDLSPLGEIECTGGVNRFYYKGNWKFQLDNTADFYHVNLLHRSLVDVLAEQQGIDISQVSSENSEALNVSLGGGHTLMDIRPYNRKHGGHVRDTVLRGGGPQGDYINALKTAYGEERTEELLVAGGTHMAVWPNLGVLSGMIRRIRPISVDLTEVILTPALLKGVPEQVNTARLRGHESFFPPAGMGGSDDQEVFERVQLGLQATANPWMYIGRGMHRETVHENGSITSQVTDEANVRGIFRHWTEVMTDGTGE